MSADALPSGERTRELLAMRASPKPASAVSTVITLAWRALLKIKHVPFQLFDVTVTPIMFTLLFTYIFGGALAGSPREYIQYLLPGIVVQTIIFITVYTGVGLNTDIQKGLYDRFRSLPIWQPSPLFGALAGSRLVRNLRSSNRFRQACCFGALIGIFGVLIHSFVDFGLHVMVNALVFIAVIVIGTANIDPEAEPR